MSHHHRSALAVFALSAISAVLGTARAAGTSYEAYSSLTNLQYTLTDLRPGDGVAASVNFSTSGTLAFTGGLAVIDDTLHGTQIGLDIQPAASPFNATASTTYLQPDNTFAGGFVQGNTLAASIRLTQPDQGLYAEATAAAINVQFTANLDDTALQSIQDTVILAPHSQLTITGLAKYGLMRLSGGNCEDCSVYVQAWSALMSSELFPQFADPTQDNDLFEQVTRVEGLYDSFGINQMFEQGLPDQSLTQLLSLNLINDSDEVKRFGFIATTWAQAQSFQSPVPEPGTWGLALGGLMVVGAAARRRSR